MHSTSVVLVVALVAAVLPPLAVGQDPCVPTHADPATINQVNVPVTGQTYYAEERDSVVSNSPPIPESGLATGNGTWLYEETNGLPGTLERGGLGLFGDWFPPGCDQTPDPAPDGVPCLIMDEDPINDETCGAGPDTVITGGVKADGSQTVTADIDGDGEDEVITIMKGNGDGNDDSQTADLDGDGDMDIVIVELPPR